MLLNLILSILVLCLIFLTICSFWTIRSFAPWVPAFQKDLPRIFSVAGLKDGEVFYDLGCGEGRVVLYAAKHFAVTAIGIELIFPLFVVCKLRQWFAHTKNVMFKNKNLFDEDLSQADVIYVFGMQGTLADKVKQKFQKQLKPGARVVSYVFKIQGLSPELVSKPKPEDNSIYLYRF